MRHAEFNHPVLVMVYDAELGWSRADDFFLSVVGEPPAARVLDLGCGTGRLALAMAAAGHAVTGVDPARASLDAARGKPGADQVTWIEGTSSVLPDAAFDVAVMTSHVAQFFVTDAEWRQVLADLKRALVPGGRPTFDTRDPRARAWERWNPADSRREIPLPDGRTVTSVTDVDSVADGVVSFTIRYTFSDGEELRSSADLRFRTEAELRSSLAEAGFAIEHIYGGWNREAPGARSRADIECGSEDHDRQRQRRVAARGAQRGHRGHSGQAPGAGSTVQSDTEHAAESPHTYISAVATANGRNYIVALCRPRPCRS